MPQPTPQYEHTDLTLSTAMSSSVRATSLLVLSTPLPADARQPLLRPGHLRCNQPVTFASRRAARRGDLRVAAT
jgi:hypothetical protein